MATDCLMRGDAVLRYYGLIRMQTLMGTGYQCGGIRTRHRPERSDG